MNKVIIAHETAIYRDPPIYSFTGKRKLGRPLAE
jgi:hypothetical protein